MNKEKEMLILKELLFEKGYNSIAEFAKKSELNPATVYRFFEGKRVVGNTRWSILKQLELTERKLSQIKEDYVL